jgi:hypothetical protein
MLHEDQKTISKNDLRVLINSFKLKNFLEKDFFPKNERDRLKKERILNEIMAVQSEKIEIVKQRLDSLRKSPANEPRNAHIDRIERLLEILERNHSKLTETMTSLSADSSKARPKGHLESDKGTSFLKLNQIGNFNDHVIQLFPEPPSNSKLKRPLNMNNYKVKLTPEAVSGEKVKTLKAKKAMIQPPAQYKFVTASPLLDVVHRDNPINYKVQTLPDYPRVAAMLNANYEDAYAFDKIDMLEKDPRSLVNSDHSPKELLPFDRDINGSSTSHDSNISMQSLHLADNSTTGGGGFVVGDMSSALTELTDELNELEGIANQTSLFADLDLALNPALNQTFEDLFAGFVGNLWNEPQHQTENFDNSTEEISTTEQIWVKFWKFRR